MVRRKPKLSISPESETENRRTCNAGSFSMVCGEGGQKIPLFYYLVWKTIYNIFFKENK